MRKISKVGFIGLGDQGGPMAEAVDEQGFELYVWARRSGLADRRGRSTAPRTRHSELTPVS